MFALKLHIIFAWFVYNVGLFESIQISQFTRQKCARKNSTVFTYDVQVSNLALHGVCVNLAHVPTPVCFTNVADVEVPCLVFAVGDADAMVLGDDMYVDGQYRLGVDPQPSYLEPNELCIIFLATSRFVSH